MFLKLLGHPALDKFIFFNLIIDKTPGKVRREIIINNAPFDLLANSSQFGLEFKKDHLTVDVNKKGFN